MDLLFCGVKSFSTYMLVIVYWLDGYSYKFMLALSVECVVPVVPVSFLWHIGCGCGCGHTQFSLNAHWPLLVSSVQNSET